MGSEDRFDPARLFGCTVFDATGHALGRVTALVHRGGGCDVLVERRHWLRHTVVRCDINDLVEDGGRAYRLAGSHQRSLGPSDGRVA